MRCSGKVAIVTGAGRGIGLAIVTALAREGADVVAVARRQENAKKAAAAAEALGRTAVGLGADVSKPGEARSIVDAALQRFGRIDILVSNAGIHLCAPFVEETEALWMDMLRVNVLGSFFMVQAVAPHMMAKKSGRIVLMGSKAAVVGEQNHVGYSASKGAVHAMTRALAVDLAKYNVTVNAVAPGPTKTDMLVEAVPDEAVQAKIAAAAPLARLGRVEDIAAAALYLASDDADWVTGQIISVDGGLSILQ
jgi:NAD(P)-dependent dehydrogenase (short-subunit alcohol dehydrogenase family)